jgi:serine phosphatase RsbU (regulator of sigma subunit)
MNLFTPQAAIHLENSELYAGLERKVNERTQELQHQKQIVEEKNKDIQDSIVYASRLQDALFPATDAFYQYFKDSEIYLRPKDVVSGDFYWYEIQGDVIYFAAADCTGHGVPGALLSIIGNNLLTDIVKSNPGIEPAEALTQLHQALLAKLRQKSDNHPLDGMDIALCRYDRISRNLIFAGAGRPLLHFRNNELIEYKSEKNCIGGHTPVDYPFTQTVIHVAQGDLIYLFSDGYTDQFGGNNGSVPRKMTSRPLREIIVNDSASPIHSINEKLIQQFNDWKGNNDQTDDMMLIGVRLT